MKLEDMVLNAQKNSNIRSDIINEYKNFISSCAKKSIGKYITDQDDEMSIAMIAFNEAITKYDKSKGSFLNFATITIKNRLIDFIRKEYKNSNIVTFSQLSQIDKDGAEINFDIEDTNNENSDAKFELEAITSELKRYDISFLSLPEVTPKSKKTKSACFSVIKYIIQNHILISEIKLKGTIPIKSILDVVKINRKVIERHRKYIITAVIILTGEYDIISEYFKDIKEV